MAGRRLEDDDETEVTEYEILPGNMYATEYEGIVNMLKRWFTSSSSESMRDWVEKFMILKNCPSCNGARFKKESLWFKVDEKNIAELSELNLEQTAGLVYRY